ncbi:protein kinase domain protein [Aspergillus clavatus NRRL 1]|uniref:non-specific serine/threonine protein kinase n=1 Tax=Aspergillus clavatus (strain ATCC 1007 / CBS 513.65 / DSM 816 / NCTC 3887 / NRRL 1 / QM 1276 / 107) TaxID=344612 RepID=A1CKU2_ASPCL|nr:protein kinase domain protein [Aspergillus clavatus NRRL 1]EAW09766.1 protein kinase domain protein [Aspergillus clavatus NRRL 1]
MSAYHRPPAKLTRVISFLPCFRLVSRAMSSSFIQEENQNPNYDPRKYYPARVGETISRRYRVISKLGWGANSTVWLAKDTTRSSNQYVTLKITNCGKEEQRSANEEVEMSRYISQLQSDHEGRKYVRLVRESFSIRGALGEHFCLVFEPLREPLWLLGKHLGSNGVPPAVLKPFLKLLLQGLDFLHSECHIIHTDLKADNLLLGFEDSGVLESYARQQENNPAPFGDDHGRPVFQSRPDFGHLRKGVGLVQISDFSAAVFGNVAEPHNHDIQPLPFCAPEVLLKATWTYSADIWNLGTMLWELLADRVLFDGLDPGSSTYSRVKHIAQIIRLLGPPPQLLLERADQGICSELFSSHGMMSATSIISGDN